jgi:peroxiredoxin
MSLQEDLDAFKVDFETNMAPPAVVAIIHKATAELIASGQATRALKIGDRAPAFNLPDSDGTLVDSGLLLRRGPLVLTFYRGFWCPYCNMDLKAVEAAAADFRDRGASLVTISQQTPVNSRKSKEQNGLSFPIVNDHGGRIADAFGIRFRLPDYLVEVYKGFGVDLATVNGEPSWTLPMPSRYVIARDGSIAYAEVNPDYTRRPDPSELFPALERLQKAAVA